MSNTTNYNLVKPSEGSSGWANDVNDNFDTIDANMKANNDSIQDIGSDLNEHKAGGSPHTTADILSQLSEQMNLGGDLEHLLLAIVGTDNPAYMKNLNELYDHVRGAAAYHNSFHISHKSTTVYDVLNSLLDTNTYQYTIKHTADGNALDITEGALKVYAGITLYSLEESIDTGISIQINKDETDFYSPCNDGSVKIHKQIETYNSSTKEHLDKIAISGLTSDTTYKIVVQFHKVDASDPEQMNQ